LGDFPTLLGQSGEYSPADRLEIGAICEVREAGLLCNVDRGSVAVG
jgi:hypothetical protein